MCKYKLWYIYTISLSICIFTKYKLTGSPSSKLEFHFQLYVQLYVTGTLIFSLYILCFHCWRWIIQVSLTVITEVKSVIYTCLHQQKFQPLHCKIFNQRADPQHFVVLITFVSVPEQGATKVDFWQTNGENLILEKKKSEVLYFCLQCFHYNMIGWESFQISS